MTKQAILTVAPSASGKSSWTEQFIRNRGDWCNIERDEIRFELFTDGKRDWTAYKFNKKNEEVVTKEYNSRLDQTIRLGYNVILSDTFLNEKYRNQMIDKLESEGYEVTIKDDWDIDWETIRTRNIQREGGISESVLWDQWLRYLDYKGLKDSYVPDESKPLSVVVDLDGSVAEMKGIRKPYEWSKVHHDLPIEPVVNIVKGLYLQGYSVVFLSGRDGCCEDETLAWLYDVFRDMDFTLYMRASGDSRKDYVVKRELFNDNVRDNYNVQMVIDDRKSVVELWEELDIKVINVGKLYERF